MIPFNGIQKNMKLKTKYVLGINDPLKEDDL